MSVHPVVDFDAGAHYVNGRHNEMCAVVRARKRFDASQLFPDGYMIHMRVWEVPQPVPPSDHNFKYALFYGRPEERTILYDNERGKGDHRHYGAREEAYRFTSVERLIEDFLADVRAVRGDTE